MASARAGQVGGLGENVLKMGRPRPLSDDACILYTGAFRFGNAPVYSIHAGLSSDSVAGHVINYGVARSGASIYCILHELAAEGDIINHQNKRQ